MERSLAAKSAKSVFYEDFNDIDIYIEDTCPGYEKIFEEIFRRALEPKYRVAKIFPMGPKTSVIRDHESQGGEFNRPTLYIVDGDLDLMHKDGDSKPGIYHLPYYCIENILLDEGSLQEILNEEDPLTPQPVLIKKFNYESWKKNNTELLVKLFIEYGTCFKLAPDIPTVSYEIKNLISSNSGDLDPQKTNNRINQISSTVLERVGEDKYKETKKQITTRLNQDPENSLRFISGKDYILPLLYIRLRTITKTKTPKLNIKTRLAMKCNISKIIACQNYIGLANNKPLEFDQAQ